MTFVIHRRFPRRSGHHSFTLIELLTVMTIIAIMAAVSIPLLSSFSTERDLTNSANTVWNLADLGRSQAIARSTVVQLYVVTGTPAPDTAPFRAVSLWAYDQTSGGYDQISQWEHLPNSVQIASNIDPYSSYQATNSTMGVPGIHITNVTQLNNAATNVTFNGQAVTADYLQFLPSGAVATPSGVISTNLYIFLLKTTSVNSTLLKDWRIVQISSLVGHSKVIAP